METEYKCASCEKQLSTTEVNANDDFGIIVSDYVCCHCYLKISKKGD